MKGFFKVKTDEILSDRNPVNHREEPFDWLKWRAFVTGRFCSYLESLVGFSTEGSFLVVLRESFDSKRREDETTGYSTYTIQQLLG